MAEDGVGLKAVKELSLSSNIILVASPAEAEITLKQILIPIDYTNEEIKLNQS